MRPTPSTCPVCGEALTVVRLTCPACDTSVEGHFQFSRLERLTAEQRRFVEAFIACEGKLTWLAQEMGVSYPTVRSRLDEVIRALGYEPRESAPAEEKQRQAEQRQAVLDDLAAGKIDPERALRLLQGAERSEGRPQ